MMKRGMVAALMACTVAVGAGCSQKPNEIPATMDTAGAEFKGQAEEIVNRYALGLIDRDVALMDQLLATEVLNRMKTYEGGLEGFVEAQRRVMLRSVQGMAAAGVGAGFRVTRTAKQEGMVAVRLSRDGVELPKPFHFVLENDGYKLNIAPKGFTNPKPAGAGADEHYLVTNGGKWPVSAECDGGGSVNVPAGGSRTVSCPNRCGRWFAGAYFNGTNWIGQTHYCDYNTWGADVIYEGNFHPPATIPGMHCNDPC
jgi:hypothetical protein